jgi:hypothetical protein
MPHKYSSGRRHRIPKTRYKVTNWKAYEAGLRQRGSLTIWFIAALVADGAYDQDRVYDAVAEHSAEAAVIVPPRATAVLSPSADTDPTQRYRQYPGHCRARPDGLAAYLGLQCEGRGGGRDEPI